METLKVTGPTLATLVDRIEDGVVSSKGAKKVFEAMATSGEDVDSTIEALGVAQITDEQTISQFVDETFAANKAQAEQFLAGNQKLFGFFVGAVLRASGGRAAPDVVNRLIRAKLN